jgi:hypothetical protein
MEGNGMPVLKRELHRRVRGPVLMDEDWWRLVFDTDTNRFYVEREWDHVDVAKGGTASKGKSETDVTAFLNAEGMAEAKAELARLLTSLFEGSADA